jgi:hypothetical protein
MDIVTSELLSQLTPLGLFSYTLNYDFAWLAGIKAMHQINLSYIYSVQE